MALEGASIHEKFPADMPEKQETETSNVQRSTSNVE
jgi:hypothetical protein